MKNATILIALLFSTILSTTYAQEGAPKKEEINKKVGDAFAKKDLKGGFEEGWNKNTQFGINFNASGFNQGWRDVNSGVEGNTMLNFILNHKNALLRGKNIWVNDLQGNIGFLKPQDGAFNRNVDKLFINSMYGRELSEKLSYYVEGNFISQFLTVRDKGEVSKRNVKSAFMAPGYLTFSTGIEYKPKEYLSIKVAPLANKFTFVTNKNVKVTNIEEGTAYGVKVLDGKKSISEFGSQVTLGFNKELVKNVNLAFRYNLFQAWVKNPTTDKLKSTDHRLDLVTTASINKYLNVNFTLIGIQDKDAINELQLATGFGVGFLANF